MQSKKVKQAVALAVDTLMMRGAFKMRDAAIMADQSLSEKDYSTADLTDIRLTALMTAVKTYATHPLSDGDVERLLINIPKEFREAMPEIRLCICEKPGSEAEWVGSMFADVDKAWKNNMDMKEDIARHTAMAAEDVRFIYDMLKFSGKNRLIEFCEKVA